MSLATQLVGVSQSLIEKFGTIATLNQLTARTSTGPARSPVYGAAPTASIRIVDYDQRSRDSSGQSAEITRKVLISTSAGVVPAKGDTITLDGREHEITTVQRITLSGTTVVYIADLVS